MHTSLISSRPAIAALVRAAHNPDAAPDAWAADCPIAAPALTFARPARSVPAAPVDGADNRKPHPTAMAPQWDTGAVDKAALAMGREAARQAGLQPGNYSSEALEALGHDVHWHHLRQEGGRIKALARIAAAHAVAGANASAGADLQGQIAQTAAYLANRYKAEFTVLDALYDLAELKMPSRRNSARLSLRRAGLEPDRLIDFSLTDYTPSFSHAMGVLHKIVRLSPWETATDFYFNADTLTEQDIARMSAQPLDEAALKRIHAQLPDSLAAGFEADYDKFTADYARICTRLLAAWIPAVAARRGWDLTGQQITVRRARAEQYLRDNRILPYEVPRDLGWARQTLPAHGYLVTFGSGAQARRVFLSALDGRAHSLPADTALRKWVQGNMQLVFGDDLARASQAQPHLQWRVETEEVAHGDHADMAQWLSPGMRAEAEANRDAARGVSWNETVKDFLLNAIPLRATIMALRKGDYLQAAMSASMDALLVLPLLGEAARGAGMAVRAAMALMRAGGAATDAMAVRASTVAQDITAALDAGMRRELTSMAGAPLENLPPPDLDLLAAAIRDKHPALAADLDATAARLRCASVRGKWLLDRRPMSALMGDSMPVDALSSAPGTIPVANEAGERMSLLDLDREAGVYTQVNAQSGERTGMVLTMDRHGALYPTMPYDTFRRCRVDPDHLRNATLVQRNRADGTVLAARRHFVPIGADHVEVVREPASSGRAVWRVVEPRLGRADPVAHRLVYDAEGDVWRRAEPSAYGLRGGGASQSRRGAWADAVAKDVGPQRTAEFQEVIVQGISGKPDPAQVAAVKALLQRMESRPRGAAILRAMRAHHAQHGVAPKVVLCGGENGAADLPRPTLGRRDRTFTWNLHLDVLAQAPSQEAEDELAAVYNNMTGILEGASDRYVPTAEEAPLSAELESAWGDWTEQADDAAAGAWEGSPISTYSADGREARARTIEALRRQIHELRAHGGITRAAMRNLLRVGNEAQAADIVARGAAVRLNSRLGLNSVPPLPPYVRSLDVSGCRIREWSNVPTNLVELKAWRCGLTKLPRTLPRSITHMDISHNALQKLDLWEGLRSVRMDYTATGGVLTIPDSLVDLEATYSGIGKFVSRRSGQLRNLNLQGSTLKAFKGQLPATLESINLSYIAPLKALPDFMLPNLRYLNLAALELRRVPPLPRSLRYLDLSSNWAFLRDEGLIIDERVMDLADCEIDLHNSGVTPESLPPPRPGQAGPYFLHLAEGGNEISRPTRTIQEAVGRWFNEDDVTGPEVAARWARIAEEQSGSSEFVQFRIFVDRLSRTINARDAEFGEDFRAEVREWLTECSKPARAKLRAKTFTLCSEANETCQDRISWTYTQLKSLRLADDISIGLYDARVADVVEAAREAFAKDALERVASRKASAIDAARKRSAEAAFGVGAYYRPCNRLDIYLAYMVKLGPRIGLHTTGVRAMRFFEVAGVSEAEIMAAFPELEARLSGPEFEGFLSREFYPWRKLLKRHFTVAYKTAEAEMQATLVARQAKRLDATIAALGLDRANPEHATLIDEAILEHGPRIQQEIQDATYQGVTRHFLATRNLAGLVDPRPLNPVPAP